MPRKICAHCTKEHDSDSLTALFPNQPNSEPVCGDCLDQFRSSKIPVYRANNSTRAKSLFPFPNTTLHKPGKLRSGDFTHPRWERKEKPGIKTLTSRGSDRQSPRPGIEAQAANFHPSAVQALVEFEDLDKKDKAVFELQKQVDELGKENRKLRAHCHKQGQIIIEKVKILSAHLLTDTSELSTDIQGKL